MIEKRTRFVYVTEDGVEHLTEREAVFHKFCKLYKAAMATKRGQNYWNETLKTFVIDSPHTLVNLFIIEPLLLIELERTVRFQENSSSTLKDFEERTKKNAT